MPGAVIGAALLVRLRNDTEVRQKKLSGNRPFLLIRFPTDGGQIRNILAALDDGDLFLHPRGSHWREGKAQEDERNQRAFEARSDNRLHSEMRKPIHLCNARASELDAP